MGNTNICQKETIPVQLMTCEGKPQNINESIITPTSKKSAGGKGNPQERKEKFLKRARIIHNNKYDYSNVDYVNNYTNIDIICPIHGVFPQTPHNHLSGQGCKVCADKIRSSKRASSTEEFVKKAISKYGNKYDYSKFVYERSFVKGIIICKIHGEFLQNPNNHLRGAECPDCYGTPKKTTLEFISDAKKLWGDRYDYSKVDYKGNKKKVIIVCPKHGEFLQNPNGHLNGDGCFRCQSSRGEMRILKFLENNKIDYISQKTFVDCRNPKTGQMLKFDFYIPSKNILIEYDGQQHFCVGDFGSFKFGQAELKEVQFRDKIKSKYAKKYCIKLIRIKYTSFSMIDDILQKQIGLDVMSNVCYAKSNK